MMIPEGPAALPDAILQMVFVFNSVFDMGFLRVVLQIPRKFNGRFS